MTSDSHRRAGSQHPSGGSPFLVPRIQEADWHSITELLERQLEVAVVRHDNGSLHVSSDNIQEDCE